MEKIELSTNFTMISLLRLLKLSEVLIELLFITPRSAIYPLKRFIIGVTTPVSARKLHQLERFRQFTRAGQVRSTTHVEPFTLAINRYFLALGDDVLDDFYFVAFTNLAKGLLCRVTIPDLTSDG